MNEIECANCGKLNIDVNYCNWNCHIELAKKNGGKVICPNGLPITCVRWDNTMMEHEHADNPNYKFPIKIEYIGTEYLDDEVFQAIETHAIIFVDKNVCLTEYECTFAIWSSVDGKCFGGNLYSNEVKDWKITNKSLEKIKQYLLDKDVK